MSFYIDRFCFLQMLSNKWSNLFQFMEHRHLSHALRWTNHEYFTCANIYIKTYTINCENSITYRARGVQKTDQIVNLTELVTSFWFKSKFSVVGSLLDWKLSKPKKSVRFCFGFLRKPTQTDKPTYIYLIKNIIRWEYQVKPIRV